MAPSSSRKPHTCSPPLLQGSRCFVVRLALSTVLLLACLSCCPAPNHKTLQGGWKPLQTVTVNSKQSPFFSNTYRCLSPSAKGSQPAVRLDYGEHHLHAEALRAKKRQALWAEDNSSPSNEENDVRPWCEFTLLLNIFIFLLNSRNNRVAEFWKIQLYLAVGTDIFAWQFVGSKIFVYRSLRGSSEFWQISPKSLQTWDYYYFLDYCQLFWDPRSWDASCSLNTMALNVTGLPPKKKLVR